MISFADGEGSDFDFDEDLFGPEIDLNDPEVVKGLKKLLTKIIGDPYEEGSVHKSLAPLDLVKLITDIMYKQEYKILNLTLSKEPSNTLKATINLKEK